MARKKRWTYKLKSYEQNAYYPRWSWSVIDTFGRIDNTECPSKRMAHRIAKLLNEDTEGGSR